MQAVTVELHGHPEGRRHFLAGRYFRRSQRAKLLASVPLRVCLSVEAASCAQLSAASSHCTCPARALAPSCYPSFRMHLLVA